MNRLSVYFTAPKELEIREEPIPLLAPEQVLVRTIYSAISPGTELLIYRKQIPPYVRKDLAISSLSGNYTYPLKYGYSAVGKVVRLGKRVDQAWLGRDVIAFHPHESYFTAELETLIEIPPGIALADAVFLPNMETAVNFVMDGQPGIGENVSVFGQGIVGLLTTSLLSQFPLKSLITFDYHKLRRQASLRMGASLSLSPEDKDAIIRLKTALNSNGCDLTYEISGHGTGLNQAVALTGFDGRIVIGSWYGEKPVNLHLGTAFHRSRIRLISSQVSTLSPSNTGRWNKTRRFNTAWQMLKQIRPSTMISLYIPVTQADKAFKLLDENPKDFIQIIFTYPPSRL